MIYDVQVARSQYQQQGIETALVRAAIDLARRHNFHDGSLSWSPIRIKLRPDANPGHQARAVRYWGELTAYQGDSPNAFHA
jgi:hypothetical protein